MAQRPQTEVTVSPAASGPTALAVSIIALAISGLSLYETVLKQPRLTLYASENWRYGRGPGAPQEWIVVPIAIANHGAREGAVLSITLRIEDGGGREKIFESHYLTSASGEPIQLFAPIAVEGRGSYTFSVQFQPKTSEPLIIEKPGRFSATLTIETAFPRSYGLLDAWATFEPEPSRRVLSIDRIDVAALLVEGKTASLRAEHAPE